MAKINLTSTTGSGFLETDFDQLKDALQDGGVEVDTITIQPAAASTSLTLDQDNNARGLYIDSEATSNSAIYIDSVQTSGNVIDVQAVGVTSGFVLNLNQDSAGASGGVINARNDGTGTGITIDQNGDSIGLLIDSEATTKTNYGINVVTGQGAIAANFQYDANNLAAFGRPADDTTASNNIYRNKSSVDTSCPVFLIEQDNASDDQNALNVQQDGTGSSIFIDQNGVTPSNRAALQLDNTGNTSLGAWLYTNEGASTQPLTFIEADNTAFDQEALKIQQDGTGYAFNIDYDGTPTTYGVQIEKSAGTQNVRLLDNAQTTGSNWFYRSEAAATTAGPVVFIEQDEATDDQNALTIQQDGTGQGILINSVGPGFRLNQAGDNVGVLIDSDATTNTNYALEVEALSGARPVKFTTQATDYYEKKQQNSGDGANLFYRNEDSTTTAGPVVWIRQDHATDDQNGLTIQNDGTGYGLFIDQNGNEEAIRVDHEGTTTAIVNLDGNALTTAPGLWVNSNSASFVGTLYDGSGGLVTAKVQNASATGVALAAIQKGTGNALSVLNDNTGNGVFIDQNGNGIAMQIDNDGANYGIDVVNSGGEWAARFDDDSQGADTMYARLAKATNGGGSVRIYRNLDSITTAGPVAYIINDHASDDQNALSVQNDGTGNGINIDQNGAGVALNVDQDGDAQAVRIDTTASTNTSYGMYLTAGSGARPIRVQTSNNAVLQMYPENDSTGTLYLYRNLDSAFTAGPVFALTQDHATDDQPALAIQQDGTGPAIDVNGGSLVMTAQSATGDGTTTIDWDQGNMFNFQFGAFNETFTFTAPTRPGTFILKLVQDSVGSRTATWPASVKWSGGTAPTLTTTATTGTDIIKFYYDGTSYFAVETLDFS